MDYRALLVKYVRYVGQVEGIDFIEDGYRGYNGDQRFTPEEWAALESASNEVASDADQ